MNWTVYTTGVVGFCSGVLVLLGYIIRWMTIRQSAGEVRRIPLMLWAASACIAAVCYLLLVALWFVDPHNVTGGTDKTFLAGLYTFITGAILWSWMLDAQTLTAAELATLVVTAAGTVVMVAGSVRSVMAIPFTSYLLFHHLVVDVGWWSAYGRTDKNLEHGIIQALYIMYYAPLVTAIMLFAAFESPASRWICIVITCLHYAVGGLRMSVEGLDVLKRYTGPNGWKATLADILILLGLILAIVSFSNAVILWPALVAAFVGNLFCVLNENAATTAPDIQLL
jgi:hypothetical protein